MKMLSLGAALAVALGIPACQRPDDGAVMAKLDDIEGRLGAIETSVQGMAKRPAGAQGQPKARPRPAPEKTYSVPVAGAPVKGDAGAPVTIVKAYEFACPYCEQARPLMTELLDEYKGKVRVAYKTFIVHPGQATTPALAACAANEQGKFATYEELIWDKAYKSRDLSEDKMVELAKEAGLNVERFKADLAGASCKARLRSDQAELRRVGVSGTPAFYVNGRHVPRRDLDSFRALIDEELGKAKKRIAQGTKPADYYAKWVVEQGEKKL